jgi:hypothetical protein
LIDHGDTEARRRKARVKFKTSGQRTQRKAAGQRENTDAAGRKGTIKIYARIQVLKNSTPE